ncbi:conserved hypothetical protein [Candidatus Magnetomoraceae bacterium gMMP-15]
MALDESRDNDNVYENEGFTYLVDKDFMNQVKPVKVDFTPLGFKISAGVEFGSPCGSCSTTGSCCSD